MNKAPCYKCDIKTPDKRYLGCHAVCSEFLKFKEIMEYEHEQRRLEHSLNRHVVDTRIRFSGYLPNRRK